MGAFAPGTRSIMYVAALSVACEVAPPIDPPTTRDSAGVAIVENGAVRMAGLPRWRLGEPTLTLGSAGGDPAHQFSEIVGATELSDGRLLIGDAESRELRIFDPSGRVVSTFGGRGEGPGELPRLHRFTVHEGDTVSVSAWPFGFLSRFGPDGDYLENRRIGPFWPGRTSTILEDGSLLLDYYEGGHGNNLELWAARGGAPTFRASGALIRAYERGPTDTVRLVRGEEWFKTGTARVDLWLAPTPFGPATVSTVDEPWVFVGETDRAEIEVRALDGELVRVIRWSGTLEPVTREDRRLHAQGLREALRQPSRAAHLERWLADAPYPGTKPAFVELATDRAGRLWVQLSPSASGETPWIVFDSRGEAVARISAPPGSRLLDIGDDYALVLLFDDFDVERIERRPVLKGG